MADNVAVTAGSGTTIAADEAVDATLGTVKFQMIKLVDGTLGGTEKAKVLAASTAPVATDPAIIVAISPNGQNANGSATSANSTPVVIASDQAIIPVGGSIANDAVDAGNPMKIGGQANTADPAAVAAADRVNALFAVNGKQVVIPALRLTKGKVKVTLTASTAETTLVAAVASTFNDLYGLIITNTSATDVASVTVRDSTAGAAMFIFAVKAGATVGFTVDAGSAIPQAAVNTNWTVQSGTSVTSLEVTAMYVANKA